jgi:hypothetical protein
MRGWFSSPRQTGRDSCPVIRLSPASSTESRRRCRAASAHPPFRFSQAGAALHLDRGSFTTRQLMSFHRGGCPGRYPWATTTALSPYRTPECSRRSRSYTDRRGDGVLRSPVVSLSGSGPRPLGRGLEGVPCVAIDPVNRLNHRCGCANTRSPGWSSGRLALTHHVWR